MSGVLVDSNVLLDVFTQDPVWFDWSSGALAAAADRARLVINAVVYAEASIRFSRIEDFDEVLPAALAIREALPFEAAFLAGKAFAAYRKRGGAKTATLPDFFIGAHAAVAGYELLTRDVGIYRSYFPLLRLIAPKGN
ncbi:MAG: type II toxin-antitoxin system VapC family toxin [Parvularculaceae bacterium]